jgi:hypothetical protein
MAFTANYHMRAISSIIRVNHLSKELAMAKRASVKAAKAPPPSRDIQFPILQRIVELLRERQNKLLEMMGNTG